MNSSRARFKLKFRDCLRNEDSTKADAIALKLRNKEQGEFWRRVNALNNKKAPLANTVNGCSLLCGPISPVVNLDMSSTARFFVEMQYMGAQD